MDGESAYGTRLAAWLARALGDSAPLFSELPFLAEVLGLALPSAVLQAPPVSSASQQSDAASSDVRDALVQLESAMESGDEGALLTAFAALGAALHDFYTALSLLMDAVRGQVTPANVPDAAARAAAEAFADQLAKKISDYAIASVLTRDNAEFAFALKLAGLLDWQYEVRDSSHDLSRAHVRKRLRLDRIKDLISDPATHFRETIGWGAPTFDPTGFFRIVLDFFRREDDIQFGVQSGDPFLRGCVLIRRDSSMSPPGLSITLLGDFDADRQERIDLTDEWSRVIESSLRVTGGVSGRLIPPLTFTLQPLGEEITGEYRTFFARNDGAGSFDILGGTGLLELSADDTTLGVTLPARWDAVASAATIDPLFFAKVQGANIRLDTAQGDGFVRGLLSRADVEGRFDLGLEWQADAGLRIIGSGGIEIALPIHRQLGPVELEVVYLALRIREDGTLSFEASTALTGQLGPLTATVDRIGAVLDLRFPESADAEFGLFDLDLRYKPPIGIGLSVNGGGFKGGGFLRFEPDQDRYAGILELEYQDRIGLKAIGLLTTRLPGGAPGFSLLISITAEFQPIQLGLGFTLNGVGGLLGLNRTARIERLRTGVRDNTLSSILFPTDIVANANRIISDLRDVFPPQADRFVFGPMAQLGWGSPTMITIDLGLVIEVPAPVQLAILGVLRGLIPDEEKKLLRLQVNFLGVLELEEQRLAFDASLYDSKLLNYPLSGDMALRLAWGNHPNLLLSVGGFHPSFQPPPLALPPLRRLTLQLTSGNNPRLTLETYFAVTSNTVQFGAKVELYASAGAFNVYGMLAFDALFQFNPFHFIADIAAKLVLRRGSSSIASITLSLTLEGTTPWRARGTARLKLCWFLTVKVRFDRTFGETRDTRLDDVAVRPLLQAALQNRQNWRPRLPAGSHLLVTVREPEGAGESIVAHPVGVLEVSQKVLPLNVRIERFGHQKPSDGREFRIENVRANGRSIGSSRVKEFFAPAQFFERSDAQKLASKSFEKYDGGVALSGVEELSSDLYAMREVEYELSYRDSQRDTLPPPARVKPEAIAFNAWASKGAIARSSLSFARTGKSALASDAVRLTQEGYGVVSMSDLSLVNESSIAASEAEAAALMNDLIARDPTLVGQIRVVPLFEAVGSVP